MSDLAKQRADAQDLVLIPVEESTKAGTVGEVVTHDGKAFIKVPKTIYNNYQQARQAAEIVWAVLHASPKFRGAKRDDVIPVAPWSRLLDKTKFEIGLEKARINGLAPPQGVKEVGRSPD